MNVQPDIAPPAETITAETIPVIDIGPLLAGADGAIEAVAAQMRQACTEIGFFYIVNHGMDQDIVDRSFAVSRDYFDLPFEEKMKVRMNRHQCGFMPPDVAVHNDTFETRNNAYNTQPTEAFKFTFDLDPDDPDYGKNIRVRGHNKWPDPNVSPGLHEAFMAFHCAFQALGEKLLAPLSVSLGMPPGFFDPFFERASSMTRIAYYPPVAAEADRIALPGHRDSSFLSFIPPATRPGLEIMTADGTWIDQPIVPEGILVNTGTALIHWINDAYLATPHRVRADGAEGRYSNIFFLYPSVDTVLECLPTCRGPGNPPRYPAITFGEFHAGFAARNFAYAEDWD